MVIDLLIIGWIMFWSVCVRVLWIILCSWLLLIIILLVGGMLIRGLRFGSVKGIVWGDIFCLIVDVSLLRDKLLKVFNCFCEMILVGFLIIGLLRIFLDGLMFLWLRFKFLYNILILNLRLSLSFVW